jgi:hypothetical protein
MIPASAKSSPIPVTQCGQVLDAPGDYLFSGILFCEVCPSAAITIRASGIHLSFAPESQFGSLCTGILISDGVSDVDIEGAGAAGFGGGLVIGKDHHVIVQGMYISGGGVVPAVGLNGGDDIVIKSNFISAALFGIVGSVRHGEFSRNVISAYNPGSTGILLRGHGNVIEDNFLGPIPSYVENVSISVTDGTVVKNNVINGGVIGIYLAGKSNHVFGNTIFGVATPDNPMGTQEGIETAIGAIHNTIKGNLVSNCLYDLFESNGPPCVNVWRDNAYESSSGAVACIH